MDEGKRIELREHIKQVIEAQKRLVLSHFAEIKLITPASVKLATIDQLRNAGATIDHLCLSLPIRSIEDIQANTENIRKRDDLEDRMIQIREEQIRKIKNYYDNLKKSLPKDVQTMKVENLGKESIRLFT